MKDNYYNNLCKLINGMALFNSSSISGAHLDRGDQLLTEFCKEFQNLYGLRHIASNMHLLRHFKKAVEEGGPAFMTACFKEEDLNGQIVDLIHGTRHAIMQIGTKLEFFRDLPLLVESVESEAAKAYCSHLIQKSLNFATSDKICHGTFVVGDFHDMSEHFLLVQDMVKAVNPGALPLRFFERLYKDHQ